ncbi:MAG: HD domain-containing protein [Candidatus Omnitrophica bacterium]|nr:HD domain-containing protein [Candidatus Omnitrophota bacterium]
MSYKLFKSISVLLILSLLWQQVGLAYPHQFDTLRKIAFDESDKAERLLTRVVKDDDIMRCFYTDNWSPFLRGHVERVGHIVLLIARRLGISDRDRVLLVYATLFHDAGFIEKQNWHSAADEVRAAKHADWSVDRIRAAAPEVLARIGLSGDLMPLVLVIAQNHLDASSMPDSTSDEIRLKQLTQTLIAADVIDASNSIERRELYGKSREVLQDTFEGLREKLAQGSISNEIFIAAENLIVTQHPAMISVICQARQVDSLPPYDHDFIQSYRAELERKFLPSWMERDLWEAFVPFNIGKRVPLISVEGDLATVLAQVEENLRAIPTTEPVEGVALIQHEPFVALDLRVDYETHTDYILVIDRALHIGSGGRVRKICTGNIKMEDYEFALYLSVYPTPNSVYFHIISLGRELDSYLRNKRLTSATFSKIVGRLRRDHPRMGISTVAAAANVEHWFAKYFSAHRASHAEYLEVNSYARIPIEDSPSLLIGQVTPPSAAVSIEGPSQDARPQGLSQI